MQFRQLPLKCCECGGRTPARIKRVGLTPHHELVVHFLCLRCRKHIYVVKDLSDCWRECPKPGDVLEAADLGAPVIREPDLDFLHSLGVRLPDEEPS